MAATKIALVRYVNIDVVGFCRDRSVEAQTLIVADLARVVRCAISAAGLAEQQVLYLPTGDGVCIALLGLLEPFDLDIRIGLTVLEKLYALALSQSEDERRFAVRIGLNENHDNLVVDITGGRNVVGHGINMAQRIMAAAGPFQLLLGPAVQARLAQRAEYRDRLRPVQLTIKHGERLRCYAYHDPALACLAVGSGRRGRPQQAGVRLPEASGLRDRAAQRQRRAAEPSFRIRRA
ncbi:MAG: hypothetical protein RLZZ124_605 [Cyanobacteriota bacterium]|jgi:class 3 adenylate cyclase